MALAHTEPGRSTFIISCFAQKSLTPSRRVRGDMIEVWKHFQVYDQGIIPSSFIRNLRPSRFHQFQLHQSALITKRSYGKAHSSSFYHRAPRLWNKLPEDVIISPTLDTFKKRLDRHWYDTKFRYDWRAPPPELTEGYIVS